MIMPVLAGLLGFAGSTIAVQTNPIVFGEGEAISIVSESHTRKLARSLALNAAQRQCIVYGLKVPPQLLDGTGYETFEYRDDIWIADFGSNYLCRHDTPADPEFYGPWPSMDESLEFILLDARMSWWEGEKRCSALGYQMAFWDILKSNWFHLHKTTPIRQLMSAQKDGSSNDTTYLWAADEKSGDYAFEFSNWSAEVPDVRGRLKATSFSVVCVR